jgi:hypothetical protein
MMLVDRWVNGRKVEPKVELTPEDKVYLDEQGVFDALGPGPWRQANQYEAGSLENAIIKVTRMAVPDYGMATTWLTRLVSAGWLHVRQEGPLMVYAKVSEAPEPDRRSWEERTQADLDRAHRADDRRLREEYNNAERIAEQRRHLDAGQAQLVSALHHAGFMDQLRDLIKTEVAAALAAKKETDNHG